MKTILEYINKGHIKLSNEKKLGEFINWLYFSDGLEFNGLDELLDIATLKSDLGVQNNFNTDKEVLNFIKQNINAPICDYKIVIKSNIWYMFCFCCNNILFNVEVSADSWDEDPFIKNIKKVN